MSPELRHLRAFLAVAEELSFTRAARRLHLTQSALSAQVRQLEDELGTELLTRTTRRVELTEAGRELLAHARVALDAAEEGFESARAAGRRARGTLRLGFKAGAAGELTEPILRAFAAARPEVVVEQRFLDWTDQTGALRAGDVDLAFVRPPVDLDGLRAAELVAEPRVVALPVGHPLAGRGRVEIAELRDEPAVHTPGAPREVLDWWVVSPRPDGSRPRLVEGGDGVEEMLAVVAARRGVFITAASIGRYYAHPEVVFVALTGVAPSWVALAWRAGRADPRVEAFVATARDVAARARGTVGATQRAS